ncbi:uncharacterized protein ARB_06208 [Trichophyton benhamiae CBS 112371]|uniref:Inner kinetochore subunit AME1 domain-containing protein n=1 Tax=Arthroderma benhamiae (strain ATCC MYA-4681 / CBS 112371) TaxID=663331 RepID=D4APP0_ARTBC|nr:uncharacterized protein ARB_06208 [Trichophyton benhamiae CBS 112371]EFE35251.1 conserved hypothetical protein [Trichophyton benhamiae CBS 112371]
MRLLIALYLYHSNHKVKDVNFGFTFGSPAPPSPPPPPQSPPGLPEKPPITPQSRHSTTSNKQLSIPSRASSRRSAARSSARKLHDDVSIYDIPPDDDGPEERSSKRRRISKAHSGSVTGLYTTADGIYIGKSFESSGIESSPTAHRTSVRQPPQLEPGVTDKRASGRSSSIRRTASPTGSSLRNTSPLENIRPSVESSVSAPPSLRDENQDSDVRSPNVTQKQPAGPKQRRRKRKSVVQHPKKKRKSLLQPPEVPESHETEAKDGSEQLQSSPKDSTPDAGLDRGDSPDPNDPSVPGNEPTESPRVHSPPIIDEQVDEEASEQTDGKEASDNPVVPSPAAENDVGDLVSENQLPSPEAQEAQGVEPDTAQREGSSVRDQDNTENQVTAPKNSRKRKKKGQGTDAPTQKGKASQKKDKSEGRSTVPVRVHRLPKISALQEWSDAEESTRSTPADVREPASVNPSLRPPQIPSRSGMNAADVLSQICRETLEKTLSTLDSAIERESNRTRQVEWTRKRKVVEAFGTELEGRLFEMSELLDSNYVLAMRLRKEKKEVLALRNQLMDIRKERDEIALQADEVRRRFSADESAKTEHGAINNALHDLQLAVDRSQKKVGNEDVDGSTNPFAGLEFLLRTVSQDVCSSSSDSHGGLLNQVKSFNSQLQRTAALLDRRGS